MVRKDKLLNHTTIAASSSTTMTTTAATESSGTAADTAIHTDEDAPTDKPVVVVPQQDHDDDGVVVVVMPVKRPKGRPRKVPIVVTEPSLNVNERPRRQIKHKFIRNNSYTPNSTLDSSSISDSNTATLSPLNVSAVSAEIPSTSSIAFTSSGGGVGGEIAVTTLSTEVKRKRGRPRKIRPEFETPVEVISIGDATVELVEITGDGGIAENEDSGSSGSSNSQTGGSSGGGGQGGGVDSCIVDSERFELLVVEDDLYGTSSSSSASSSPALFSSKVNATTMTTTTLSPLGTTPTMVSGHNDSASITVLMESDDTYVVTVADDNRRDNAVNHDESADSADDGTILVEISDGNDDDDDDDGKLPTSPGRRPERRNRNNAVTKCANVSPVEKKPSTTLSASKTTTNPMKAVQLAMKQLARLSGQSSKAQSVTESPPLPNGITPAAGSHTSAADTNRDSSSSPAMFSDDSASSSILPQVAVRCAPRVTRKNSILFVPTVANRSKMLAKLLAGSPSDAKLCKKLLKASTKAAAYKATAPSSPSPAKKKTNISKSSTDSDGGSVSANGVHDKSATENTPSETQTLQMIAGHDTCYVSVQPLSKEIVANGYLNNVRDSPVEEIESPAYDVVGIAAAACADDVADFDKATINQTNTTESDASAEKVSEKPDDTAITAVLTKHAAESTIDATPVTRLHVESPKTSSNTSKSVKNGDSKRCENGLSSESTSSDSRTFTPSPLLQPLSSSSEKRSKSSDGSSKPKSQPSCHDSKALTNGPTIAQHSSGSERTSKSSSTPKSISNSGNSSSSGSGGGGGNGSRKSNSDSSKKLTPHKEASSTDHSTARHSHSSTKHGDSKKSSSSSNSKTNKTSISNSDSLKKTSLPSTPTPTHSKDQQQHGQSAATPSPSQQQKTPASINRRNSIESSSKPSAVITIDKEAAARRAKRTAARLESTFRDRSSVTQKKTEPQRKFDPQAILSSCYMPKQVKHDSSLYSIEAMRAAKARVDAEAAAVLTAATAAETSQLDMFPGISSSGAVVAAAVINSDTVPSPFLAAFTTEPQKLFDHSSILPGFDPPNHSDDETIELKTTMLLSAAADGTAVDKADESVIEMIAVKNEPSKLYVHDCQADDKLTTVGLIKNQPPAMDTTEIVEPAIVTDQINDPLAPASDATQSESLALPDPAQNPSTTDEKPSILKIENSDCNQSTTTADSLHDISSNSSILDSSSGVSSASSVDLESESNNIRRSGRIKIITETKQRSRGFGLVRDKVRIHNTMSTQLTTANDQQLNNATNSSGSPTDSNDATSTSSPCGVANSPAADNCSKSPPDLLETELTPAQLEKQQRDVREGLSLFRQIRDNEFLSERNISKETRRMQCDCFLTAGEVARGEFGCGEDCMNRMLMIECGPRCVVGDRCTNKRFQRHQTSSCTIFKTEKKGFGLQASAFIASGDFIMEYVGEVLNGEQFEHRATEYGKEKNRHHYFMALRSDCVIDATIKGNISRFINHSCDPNAETQKWTVNGELRIGFFSTKDVAAGEEITFDYQFQRYGKAAQRCYCEAECCRGWIGEEPDSDDEVEDDDEELGDETSLVSKGKLSPVVDSPEQPARNLKSPQLLQKQHKAAARKTKPIKTTDKPKKTPKPKRAEIMEDPDLDMHIDILQRSQLKNQAQTLRFSRLVVRAKLRRAKSQLLRILCAGELACRRLFLDYHGLKLLHAWMCDSDAAEASDVAGSDAAAAADEKEKRLAGDWAFRLEILQTLQVLPIPNKLLLDDSKVLKTVSEWSTLKTEADAVEVFEIATATADAKIEPLAAAVDGDTAPESGTTTTPTTTPCDIPKLLEENTLIKDINLDALKEIITTNEANAKRLNAEAKVKPEQPPAAKIPTTATAAAAAPKPPAILSEIVALANVLVASWSQLPEVFRIPKKQRIEQMKEHEREANRNYRALGNPSDSDNSSDSIEAQRRRNMDRFRERERRGTVDSRSPLPLQQSSSLALSSNSTPGTSACSIGGSSTMSPLSVPPPGMFHRPPPPSSSSALSSAMHQNPSTESGLTKQQRRQMFEARVAAEKQISDQQHLHSMKCAFFNINPRTTTELSLPFFVDPVNNQWYGRYGHPLATPPIYAHIQRPPTSNPADYQMPTVELPAHWRYQIDAIGRLYFYHEKIRIPQWDPPIKLMPLNDNDANGTSAEMLNETNASKTETNSSKADDPDAAAAAASDSDSDNEDSTITEAKQLTIIEKIQQSIGAQRVHINILTRQPSSLDLMAEITALASTTGEPTAQPSNAQLDAAAESIIENRAQIQFDQNHRKMRQEREMSPRSLEERRMHRTEKRVYRANKEKVRCEKRLLALQTKHNAAAASAATAASTSPSTASGSGGGIEQELEDLSSDGSALPAKKARHNDDADVTDAIGNDLITVEDVGAYTTICTTGLNGQIIEDDGDDEGDEVSVTVTVANANGTNSGGIDDEDDSDADMDDDVDSSFVVGGPNAVDDDEDDDIGDVGNYAKLHGVDELSMDDAVIVRKTKRRALAMAMEDHAPSWNAAHRRHAVATAACPKRKKLDEPLVANISATATAAAMLEARESPISMEKRIKDKFRSNIAGDVVNILTNYRLDTCTVGHITNDDDFKHLAKKLSHFVMLKELKHCDNTIDALEVNESVRAKAREFVRKYMLKFGATYKRSENELQHQ